MFHSRNASEMKCRKMMVNRGSRILGSIHGSFSWVEEFYYWNYKKCGGLSLIVAECDNGLVKSYFGNTAKLKKRIDWQKQKNILVFFFKQRLHRMTSRLQASGFAFSSRHSSFWLFQYMLNGVRNSMQFNYMFSQRYKSQGKDVMRMFCIIKHMLKFQWNPLNSVKAVLNNTETWGANYSKHVHDLLGVSFLIMQK